MAMHATDVGLRPLVKAMANRANAMGRRTLLRLDELAMQQVDGEFSTLHNISLNPSLAALHVHAPPTQTNDALHKSRHWITKHKATVGSTLTQTDANAFPLLWPSTRGTAARLVGSQVRHGYKRSRRRWWARRARAAQSPLDALEGYKDDSSLASGDHKPVKPVHASALPPRPATPPTSPAPTEVAISGFDEDEAARRGWLDIALPTAVWCSGGGGPGLHALAVARSNSVRSADAASVGVSPVCEIGPLDAWFEDSLTTTTGSLALVSRLDMEPLSHRDIMDRLRDSAFDGHPVYKTVHAAMAADQDAGARAEALDELTAFRAHASLVVNTLDGVLAAQSRAAFADLPASWWSRLHACHSTVEAARTAAAKALDASASAPLDVILGHSDPVAFAVTGVGAGAGAGSDAAMEEAHPQDADWYAALAACRDRRAQVVAELLGLAAEARDASAGRTAAAASMLNTTYLCAGVGTTLLLAVSALTGHIWGTALALLAGTVGLAVGHTVHSTSVDAAKSCNTLASTLSGIASVPTTAATGTKEQLSANSDS